MTDSTEFAEGWHGAVCIIDSAGKLEEALTDLAHYAFLSIGFKSSSLHAKGSIAVISIKATQTIYLFDVQTMGEQIFDLKSRDETTLKSILQNDAVKKLVFDVRNAANALFGIYGIRLNNVLDLQLFQLATNPPATRRFVWSLDKAVVKSGVLSETYQTVFSEARKAFAEEFITARGGDGSQLHKRPMSESMIAHSAMDIYFLGQVYDTCRSQLASHWIPIIREETDRRIKAACEPEYLPWSLEKKLGPRGWKFVHA